MSESEYRLGMLVSGGATTAAAVIEACRGGILVGKFDPVVVIASKPGAGERVREIGMEPVLVPRQLGKKPEDQYDDELRAVLMQYGVDVVMQLGHRARTPSKTVAAFKGRIANQHPVSLSPGYGGADFGGRGMMGSAAVCAAVLFDWTAQFPLGYTESTIHHVVPIYDSGNLIRVEPMKLPSAPRAQTIAEWAIAPRDLMEATQVVQRQLLPLEHANVIASLDDYWQRGGFLSWVRTTPLVNPADEHMLLESKKTAVQLFPNG